MSDADRQQHQPAEASDAQTHANASSPEVIAADRARRRRAIAQLAKIGMADGLTEADADSDAALVMDCNGRSVVIGHSRRSGRTIRAPARYQPTMDNTPYGRIDLRDLDTAELDDVADGSTDDIESVGEEEEQDERELDAELAHAQPTAEDLAFVANDADADADAAEPSAKRTRLEDAFVADDDADFVAEDEDDETTEDEDAAGEGDGPIDDDDDDDDEDEDEEEEEEEEEDEEEEEEEDA